jgi:hypothetical protein
MAYNFPDSPTPGQVFNQWTWDAATGAWKLTGPEAFPTGTVMLFYQGSAPVGWTKVTTQNDKALRVVSGSGGVAGGTNAFSTVMAQTIVGGSTLAASQQASMSVSGSASVLGTVPWITDNFNIASNPTGAAMAYGGGSTNIGSSGSISGTAAGSGGSHNHPITMAIQYIDVILASKN